VLFQHPKHNFGLQNVSDSAWFENKLLGKNSIGDLMVKISKAAGLSKVYTNHSIRSTSITLLSRVGREIPVAGIPSGNYREIPSWEIL
jgi:hypothetical protein